MDLIKALPESEEKKQLLETQNRLIEIYTLLSDVYHNEKESNVSNSLVLG
jgi:hypothetical protein